MTAVTKVTIVIGLLVAVIAPVLQLSIQSINPIAAAASYLLVLTIFGVGLWIAFRLSNTEFGWRIGKMSDYLLALAHPTLAMIVLVALAIMHGKVVLFEAIEVQALFRGIAIMSAATFIAVLITEEGFFRGALWGVAERANWNSPTILLWTTVCFVAWHAAIPFIDPSYQIPPAALPIYFSNATLISLAFGLLRMGSGSLVVASVAHGLWNGLAYNLFGYGAEAGDLGIVDFDVYGPERGFYGLAVNLLALLLLLIWARSRRNPH